MKNMCCLFLLVLPVLLQAADDTKRSATTEQWLQMQRDGLQASTTPQAVTPAERELAYQRWLDSFRHPIPDFFSDEGGEITSR